MHLLSLLALGACRPDPAGEAPGEGENADLVEIGPVEPCDAPLAAPAWVDEATARGLAGPTQPATDPHQGGIAVGDLDGDGDDDLVLTYASGPPVLYRNEGDTFVPSDLPAPAHPAYPALVDLDGDSDDDLAIGGAPYDGAHTPPALLRNDGDGRFTPIDLPDLPLAAHDLVRVFAPADADGDGNVDLFAAVWSDVFGHDPDSTGPDPDVDERDLLLLGDGQGGFAASAVPGEGRPGFDARWWDADRDGDPDLYVVNDFNRGNVLFRNEGGVLVDDAGACGCTPAHSGMGVDLDDLDGDGWPDLLLTGGPQNILLGSGSGYADVAASWGADTLDGTTMSWGGVLADMDDDGRTDAWVAEGGMDGSLGGAPIRALRNRAGAFEDDDEGLARTGTHRALVARDLNVDGVLDLAATDLDDAPHLYLSTGCTAASWLEIAAPSGSRVEVRSGDETWTRWVSSRSGCGASASPVAHVGLGGHARVDAVEVELPDGTRVALEGDLEARRRLHVRAP